MLLHKLREAMAEEMKGRKLGGEGKVAEVDGGYFGGYVKPANIAKTAAIAARPQSNRQAQGRRHHPRAQWPFAPGRVPYRRAGHFIDQVAHRQGNDRQCGRRKLLGCAACPLTK